MITTVIIDATMVGQVISPRPDQFITRMVMTESQQPPLQVENWVDLPPPHGRWTSGRVVLTDLGGAGRRLLNFATQYGVFFGSTVLMTGGQNFRFRGDLVLECLPQNQVWEIDFSDVPVAKAA
jgi:hypothetical protein